MNLFHLIHQAEQRAARIFSRSTAELTYAQAVFLCTISDMRRAKMTDLVRSTNIDRSTTSGVMRTLERKGFIDVQVNDRDNRARDVRLTAAGKVAAAEAKKLLILTDSAVRAALPSGRSDAFWDALERIVDDISKQCTPSDEAPPTKT